MIRTLLASLMAIVVSAGSAAAQCNPLPNNLTNGTNADATQVMANFNGIITCPRFTPSGSLQVTKNSAGAATFPLLLQNSGSTANTGVGISFDTTGNGVGARDAQIIATTNGGNQVSLSFLIANASLPTEAMRISYAGYVGIATTTPSRPFDVNGAAGGTQAWISPSDARLKTDVRQISDALDLVKRLRGVRYQWRPADERPVGKTLNLPADEMQIGFIAQEVEGVVPEAVVAPAKDVPDGVYALKETNLLPVLVEAIKEQQAQIESLKREVATLKASKLAVVNVGASSTAER